MSFFANLVAGMGTGLGKGFVTEADYQDKLEAQQLLQAEKQAAALELQRQRTEDRQLLAAATKGSGGPGGGDDLFGMLKSAKTPQEQQQVLGYIKSFAGPEAAMLLEENVFGRMQTKEAPADFVGLPGQADIGPDAKIQERVAYDRERGQQALGRVYALLANKGQTKSHAEGEAQYFANDARATAVTQELKRGKPLVEAAETGARVADPEAYDRNQANRERITASVTNANTRAQGAATNTEVREDAATVRALEARKQQYLKQLGDPMVEDDLKAVLQLEIDDINRRLKKSVTAEAPSKPTSTWTPSSSTPRTSGKLPTLDELRAKHAPR